ncbi:hypothetical protein BDK51DRAFT_44750, partial [Blyttiomyces helicus]
MPPPCPSPSTRLLSKSSLFAPSLPVRRLGTRQPTAPLKGPPYPALSPSPAAAHSNSAFTPATENLYRRAAASGGPLPLASRHQPAPEPPPRPPPEPVPTPASARAGPEKWRDILRSVRAPAPLAAEPNRDPVPEASAERLRSKWAAVSPKTVASEPVEARRPREPSAVLEPVNAVVRNPPVQSETAPISDVRDVRDTEGSKKRAPWEAFEIPQFTRMDIVPMSEGKVDVPPVAPPPWEAPDSSTLNSSLHSQFPAADPLHPSPHRAPPSSPPPTPAPPQRPTIASI